MKQIFKHIKRQKLVMVMLLFTFLLFTMCVTITTVTQPSSATVGEQINITVDIDLTPSIGDTQNLIFGFLAPSSWDVESTGVITYTSPVGNGSMSLVPADEIAPNSAGGLPWVQEMTELFGIGQNYGEVKWVVYKSDVALVTDGSAITGQIQLSVNVGTENLKTQLGYAVALTAYGVSASDHDLLFTDCMEVTGGANPTNNLCGADPNLVIFSPENYTIEDVITMTFDATKGDSALLDAPQVYLCASAMVDGALVEACDYSASLTMNDIGNNKWRLTIWPRNLFNVAANSDISDFTYSFRNEAADIIVPNPATSVALVLEDNCN